MCITFLLVNNDRSGENPLEVAGGYDVIVTNNRDEMYNRPTKPAHFWPDYNHCIAGTDLEPGREGGTWFGVSKKGKIGMLLNILLNEFPDPDKKGRGHLVSDYLKTDITATEYLTNLSKDGHMYNAFNLILIEHSASKGWQIFYYSNTDDYEKKKDFKLSSTGVYGCGNSDLNRPFKKVTEGVNKFKNIIKLNGEVENCTKMEEKLQELMFDTEMHWPDAQLESQGQHLKTFGEDFFRERSAIFVDSRKLSYGTRTSTLVTITSDGKCRYTEKTMIEPVNNRNPEWETQTVEFDMAVKSNL